MERRDFIKSSGTICAGVIGLSWLLEACSSQKYISNPKVENNRVTISKSDFVVMKKDKRIEQKFIVIKTFLEYPIALYKINENEYQALYLQCTHQGCELNPHETMMVCPCHGAEFSTTGSVSQGPAEKNLRTFITSTDQENIYIQL